MGRLKVAVIGASGRMGSEVCRAVESDPGMELVSRIGPADDLADMTSAGAEVAVEFTTPASVKSNVDFCLEHGVHVVVGATGLTEADLDDIERRARSAGVNVFVAPNFAIGAVLMMRFAAQASPHFEVAEVVERHHEKKADAPSGTALRTAQLMNEARRDSWTVPPQGNESVAGSRGGDVEGVRVHSLRMPGSVAHQDVILGSAGETLTIRHDSLDRASFMPGVLLAIRKVRDLDPLTVGLEHLLDLA